MLRVRGTGVEPAVHTTATEDWSDEQRHADPAAGLVYRLDTGAIGRPDAPFRSDPDWWATVALDPYDQGDE